MLRHLVAEARRCYCATSLSEEIEGVAGIAAPILGKGCNLAAVLVMGAPGVRARSRIAMLERQVRDAAGEISRLMGYTDGLSSALGQ